MNHLVRQTLSKGLDSHFTVACATIVRYRLGKGPEMLRHYVVIFPSKLKVIRLKQLSRLRVIMAAKSSKSSMVSNKLSHLRGSIP